jgi:short-subunit dehydrogenase
MNTALITGASGGIGAELARIHAEKGGDLVLVARSADKLEALKTELEVAHRVNVHVIAEDLAIAGAAHRVFAKTGAMQLQVDVLINNAGFGGHGKFHERDLAAEEQMMQLNMVTLTSLTHLYLPGMVARGSGKVLNVSSSAAFLPGPLQAVYYATKAYVNSFSQAVATELVGTGVTVTALCPGPVATDFQKAGDLEGVKMWDRAVSARSAASCGYAAMERGKLVAVNQRSLSFMLNWIVPLMPRRLLLKTSRLAMEK